MDLKRIVGSSVLFAAIPLFVNGCGAADALCCTDFEVGADLSNVDFGVSGEAAASYKVLAQSSADLAAAVSGAVEDVTGACRAIAQDLGATDAEITAEDAKDRNARITGMCDLASAKVTAGLTITGGAKVGLKVDFQPPKCEASFSAKANCQATCSGSASCDATVTPPKCEGGTLSVSCDASCKADVGASIDCTGSCDVTASGSCTAQGGVDCQGKCDGTCTAGANADETGVQADGTCKGTCSGSCEVVKPGAKCEGSFKGKCSGTCAATASAKVECSGGCQGTATPLKCDGGKFTGGCTVDAKCDANCDASVSAKAECTPPSLTITATAAVDVAAQAKVGAVIDTLKVNLPAIIVVFKARGQAFVDLVGTVSGSASASVSGDLGVKGTACLIPIGEALADAATSIPVTLSASAKIAGSAGVN